MPVTPPDLTGQRFERLVAVEFVSGRGWRCACDCGATVYVPTHPLRRGLRISCGCLHAERTGARHRTHGHTHEHRGQKTETLEYRSWRAMKRRCLNPRASQYEYYGGRGITICQPWIDSFESFLRDMGPKPAPEHTLDRIDNDGPYSPDNCRWADGTTQATNSSNTVFLTHAGETDSIAGWARRLGVRKGALQLRLMRGWTAERILTAPLRVTARPAR